MSAEGLSVSQHKKTEWQLEKRVSWGHLLTTVTIIVSAITWGNKMDSRVEINAREIAHVAKDLEKETNNRKALRVEIKDDLRMINAKLDRLISSSNK